MLAIFIFSSFFNPNVSANNTLDEVCKNAPTSPVCIERNKTENPIVGANGILTRVIQIFIYFVSVASVIVIILAGLRFITAQGDPNSVSTAKKSIFYAIVGLLVAVLAQIMVLFVLNKL